MKKTLLAVFLLSAVFSASPLGAGVNTGSADRVLGQPDFIYNTTGTIDGAGLHQPYDLAQDMTTGRVYVADVNNNRVLWWDSADAL
ncbi:MAG: hypothetical protein ACYC5N_08790, partial [Endomicrobiales bacterium]